MFQLIQIMTSLDSFRKIGYLLSQINKKVNKIAMIRMETTRIQNRTHQIMKENEMLNLEVQLLSDYASSISIKANKITT